MATQQIAKEEAELKKKELLNHLYKLKSGDNETYTCVDVDYDVVLNSNPADWEVRITLQRIGETTRFSMSPSDFKIKYKKAETEKAL